MRAGGRIVPVEGAKLRALLVLLLLHPNEVVPSDRLIDDLWSGEPPSTAANALQVYVSRLRKLLGRETVVTRAPGYQLRVDLDRVDALRFERLVEEARQALAEAQPEAALRGLQEALSLWQGTPLSDFVYEPFAQNAINRLEELHVTALEEGFEARLALGRGADLVAELEALVAEHPLRERLRGQLMLALYRSGRQAEALELYQETRRLLVDELGIEPSPTLQRLETAILRQDPGLEAEAPAEPAGAPEAPPPPREARKTVTVLFLDVASDGGQLDPEPLAQVLAEAIEAATAVVEDYAGTVTELPASRLMAVFGVPLVREDDSLRAVSAAADVREALERLSDGLERDWKVRLALRAGVETGEVMAGASVTGEAVATAARLQETAALGEILVGEGTRGLLSEVATFEPSGPAFRLSSAAPAATLISRRELRLVGRKRELARLRESFDHACGERVPTLFTLLGPAGIGKSRLAAELGSLVQAEATVLRGRCLPYGKGITFWPLAEAVRQAAGATAQEAIARLLEGSADAELIARRVAAAVGRPDAETASDETSWAIRKLFESLARARPLLLVFDDLQWAETTFLDLLDSVADLSRDAPIMLLCLARPELLEERPSWGGGKVNSTSMLLDGLSDEESEALISQVLGGRTLPSATRTRVAEAAEGNPLFLEQMLAMLAERGAPVEGGLVPPTIQALLAARLDRLAPAERSVIERASVAGKEFSQDALVALADPEGESDASAARELEGLVRRELIRPASSERGEVFRFRHNLIREAAYAAIPKRVRAALHERFAAWLEHGGARGPGEHEEIVGYHLEQAYLYRVELGPVDDAARKLAERAAGHLAVVGERAYDRGDGPASSNLLSRAVALLPSESPERLDLLVDLGEALRESGEFGKAEDVLGEAIERAASAGERSLEARAFVVRLRVQMQTEANFAVPALQEATDGAIEVLERAGDERGLAKAWPVRAWFPWLQCNASAAEQALDRAAEYARRAGDERAEGYSLNLLLGSWLFGPVPVPEAIRRSEEILALPPRQQRVKASAYRALAGLVAMEGRFDEARELLERDRAIIDDMGLRVTAAVASEIWGIVEMLAGRPAEAERRLLEGYEILDAMGEKSGLSTLAAMLAHAVYAQERYDEAYRFTEISEASAPEEDRSANVYWLAARAKLLARRGLPAEGEALARKALELSEPTDFLNMRGQAAVDLGEVLRLAGRPAEAAAAVGEAVELYDQKGNTVASGSARAARSELSAAATAR